MKMSLFYPVHILFLGEHGDIRGGSQNPGLNWSTNRHTIQGNTNIKRRLKPLECFNGLDLNVNDYISYFICYILGFLTIWYN